MLTTVLVAYVRHKVPGLNKDNAAQYFQQENINELKVFLKARFVRMKANMSFLKTGLIF